MAEGYDNFWDPYCCCKVTRKNIVMSCLTIMCFALVFWTVITTSAVTEPVDISNTTQYTVSDTKDVEQIDFEMSSQKLVTYQKEKMTKYEKEEKKKFDAEDAFLTFVENIKTISRRLVAEDPETNETHAICKCVCGLNVTLSDAKAAIDFMVRKLDEDLRNYNDNKGECYNPNKYDHNTWQCLEEPKMVPFGNETAIDAQP